MPLFRRQSAAEQTSLAPHDSKARVIVVTTRRDSWRSHVHRTYIAQRVQLFKIETANVRGRGGRPLVLSLGGLKGGYSLSEKENIPLCLCRVPTRCGARSSAAALPLPAPYGRKKKQPSRAAFLPRPRRESCPNCQYGILIPISPLFSLDNMLY